MPYQKYLPKTICKQQIKSNKHCKRIRNSINSIYKAVYSIVFLLCGLNQVHAHSNCQALIQSIHVAQGIGENGELRPHEGWTTTSLPDNMDKRWRGFSGSAWYKIVWNHNCDKLTPVTLVVNRINMAGQVYINNDLIWQSKSLVEPLSRSWNMPHYWTIPSSSLKLKDNIIWIRVVGVATQESGLDKVILAPYDIAIPQYEKFLLEQHTLTIFNLGFSITLGFIAFLIWLFRPQEKGFWWFGLASLCWCMVMINMVLTEAPFGLDTLQIARLSILFLLGHAVCGCFYAWRFSQQHFARIEQILLVIFLIAVVSGLCLPNHDLFWFIPVIFILSVVINCSNFISYIFIAYKVKQTESYLLSIVFSYFLLTIIYEFFNTFIDNDYIPHIFSYTAPIITLFFSVILSMRLSKSFKQIKNFNTTLEQKVKEAQTEVSKLLKSKHALEIKNVKLQERIQLSHDLHDGIGSSLVRAIATIDQNKNYMNSTQFLSILKLLRDDLRQIIDHNSSFEVSTPESPTVWIAPLKYRFNQIFESQNITSEWSVSDKWTTLPSPNICLNIFRIAEEALTNVIKHSQATHVKVTVVVFNGQLNVTVEDNGIGFNAIEVSNSSMSVGLRSMKMRMQRIGGQLNISSKEYKTCLCATVFINNLNS